jgi:hypothetical protein
MACADECPGSVRSFMGLAGYYRRFVRGIFEDSKSDHGIAEEEQEVCLDREMRGSISEAQGVVDNNTDTKGP